MDTTYVEYDASGEIFHVSTVSTTEGAMTSPPSVADAEVHVAHQKAVDEEIARRDKAVRDELNAHIAAGKRLLILPAGAPIPQRGRHRVINGSLSQRTNAEFNAWQAAQNKPSTP